MLDHHLFALRPVNDRAKEVVNDPANASFVEFVENKPELRIGQHSSRSSAATLVAIGRHETNDIYVRNSSISRFQCTFEVNTETNIILLYDKSTINTTQVYGDKSKPFELGRARKVVVLPEWNTRLGIGGVKRDLYLFDIVWNMSSDAYSKVVKARQDAAGRLKEDSRRAPTADNADTVGPSQRLTRIHTPGCGGFPMRYIKTMDLGSGSFGTVAECIDADTGRIMAVKILKLPSPSDVDRVTIQTSIKREVEFLATLDHPHIVEYFAANKCEHQMEIFMGRMDCSLHDLVARGVGFSMNTLSHHMLMALDYLNSKEIVHRDVKPENIFCKRMNDDTYYFRLGDFGLSNLEALARSYVGTPLFMAPEVQRGLREKQNGTIDIYSLFVVFVDALNIYDFRTTKWRDYSHLCEAVAAARKHPKLVKVGDMGNEDPDARPFAAELLLRHFDGEGLTTPRNRLNLLKQSEGVASPSSPAGQAKISAAQGPEARIPPSIPGRFPRQPFRPRLGRQRIDWQMNNFEFARQQGVRKQQKSNPGGFRQSRLPVRDFW